MPTNFLHKTPDFLTKILKTNVDLNDKWQKLTPIMQNEWICWLEAPKKEETKKEHLDRFLVDLEKGEKRPCCWPGCPHRNANAQKWF